MGEDATDHSYKLVQAVVTCWKRDADLCRRATSGKIANVGDPKGLTRKDVDCNAGLLEPVLVKLGPLSAFNLWKIVNHQ